MGMEGMAAVALLLRRVPVAPAGVAASGPLKSQPQQGGDAPSQRLRQAVSRPWKMTKNHVGVNVSRAPFCTLQTSRRVKRGCGAVASALTVWTMTASVTAAASGSTSSVQCLTLASATTVRGTPSGWTLDLRMKAQPLGRLGDRRRRHPVPTMPPGARSVALVAGALPRARG